jgi:hypothetical protein
MAEMAIDNFIPEVWSARLLQYLHKSLIFGQPGVVNRDYEGEISGAGDTVRIQNFGTVTVANYTKNTNINAPEALNDAQTTLLIDQQKYFNFQIDDVDKAQQQPKIMGAAMAEAAYALANVTDQYLAGLYTGFDAGNVLIASIDDAGATQAEIDKAYGILVDASVKLDEANVPSEGRFTIISPWLEGVLLRDARFVQYGTPPQDARLTNGVIGRAAGFTILKSNNIILSTSYRMIAGHPMAWTFADQISQVEAYRPELRFADGVKGLHVYGAKVVRPTAACELRITRT